MRFAPLITDDKVPYFCLTKTHKSTKVASYLLFVMAEICQTRYICLTLIVLQQLYVSFFVWERNRGEKALYN